MKQPSAIRDGDGLGAAQDIQLFENGLDVALDRDFRDRQVSADQFVRLAFRKQAQYLQFAGRQFLSGQSFRKFGRNGGGKKRPPGMHVANALEQSQQQCDEDGTMIAVSRQAVDEAIKLLRAIPAASLSTGAE